MEEDVSDREASVEAEQFVLDGFAGISKGRKIRLSVKAWNQFAVEGVWLRANLHCHVIAAGEPGMVRDWYRRQGFDVLAATDHDEVTAFPPEQDGLVTLPGVEISRMHMVGLGLPEAPPQGDRSAAGIAEAAKAVHDRGGLAVLAHPFWTGWGWEELKAAAEAGIEGFEVVNAICYRINGKSRADQLWGMLLDRGYRPAAIGSDDAHSVEDPFAGKGWTGVLAADRSPEAVLEAIRAGRTYASEGPELRAVRWEKTGKVVVECSPCVACHFTSRAGGLRSRIADGLSERFELDLAVEGYRLGSYLYVVAEDEHGRRAWSSAMEVEKSETDR